MLKTIKISEINLWFDYFTIHISILAVFTKMIYHFLPIFSWHDLSHSDKLNQVTCQLTSKNFPTRTVWSLFKQFVEKKVFPYDFIKILVRKSLQYLCSTTWTSVWSCKTLSQTIWMEHMATGSYTCHMHCVKAYWTRKSGFC